MDKIYTLSLLVMSASGETADTFATILKNPPQSLADALEHADRTFIDLLPERLAATDEAVDQDAVLSALKLALAVGALKPADLTGLVADAGPVTNAYAAQLMQGIVDVAEKPYTLPMRSDAVVSVSASEEANFQRVATDVELAAYTPGKLLWSVLVSRPDAAELLSVLSDQNSTAKAIAKVFQNKPVSWLRANQARALQAVAAYTTSALEKWNPTPLYLLATCWMLGMLPSVKFAKVLNGVLTRLDVLAEGYYDNGDLTDVVTVDTEDVHNDVDENRADAERLFETWFSHLGDLLCAVYAVSGYAEDYPDDHPVFNGDRTVDGSATTQDNLLEYIEQADVASFGSIELRTITVSFLL